MFNLFAHWVLKRCIKRSKHNNKKQNLKVNFELDNEITLIARTHTHTHTHTKQGIVQMSDTHCAPLFLLKVPWLTVLTAVQPSYID